MMLLLNHQERESCFFFFRIERGEADMLLVLNGYKGRVLIRYASIWDARPFFHRSDRASCWGSILIHTY
jgi:hypothetical protein